jgi:hypothetical protein
MPALAPFAPGLAAAALEQPHGVGRLAQAFSGGLLFGLQPLQRREVGRDLLGELAHVLLLVGAQRRLPSARAASARLELLLDELVGVRDLALAGADHLFHEERRQAVGDQHRHLGVAVLELDAEGVVALDRDLHRPRASARSC